MATPDAAIKEFMSNKQNFADAFNLFLFHEDIVDPEKLEQLNPNLTTVLLGKQEKRARSSVERTLDDARQAAIVMADEYATYLMLGMNGVNFMQPSSLVGE